MDLARAGALEQEGIGAAARLSEKGFRPPPPAEKGLLAEPSLKISHSCLTNTNHARETQHKGVAGDGRRGAAAPVSWLSIELEWTRQTGNGEVQKRRGIGASWRPGTHQELDSMPAVARHEIQRPCTTVP